MILRRVADLRALVAGWKAAGQAVGVVPTMGALHQGHLSLVRAAKRDCGRVIVTIFVNPKQFDAADDLSRYPRTEAADAALLESVGVDAIFAPPVAEVYPDGFATTVSVAGISTPLEGEHRPGHFDGVATVVAKLFGMTAADRAYFGQKDWQQLQVVRQLVRDLDMAVQVIGCDTLRERDGLAMSSRNARLSGAARGRAGGLFAALTAAAAAMNAGHPQAQALEQAAQTLQSQGFDRIEYIALRDAATLGPVTDTGRPMRLLAAVWLDGVRLIDNIAV